MQLFLPIRHLYSHLIINSYGHKEAAEMTMVNIAKFWLFGFFISQKLGFDLLVIFLSILQNMAEKWVEIILDYIFIVIYNA